GKSGIGATLTALSAPPRMRNGNEIVRIVKTESLIRCSAIEKQWLNIQDPWNAPHIADVISRQLHLRLEDISYAEYLQTDHWKKQREDALKRAFRRCAVCNSDKSLHVHHRTYERLGCELPNDLTVLCDDCHELFHDRLPSPPSESGS